MTDETAGLPAAPPVCARHTDRVSYVRCQRCGRPACPECVVEAPVGVQCVDCVREARRAAPVPRTVFGATVRGGRPLVTLTIIALCAVSYLLQLVLGWETWTSRLAFYPPLGDVEPWRFLTGAFVHSDAPWHVLLNMYALWIVGPQLEVAFGRARFLALYLLSAVGGHTVVVLLASPAALDWYTATVGASGAVFGLFGAFFLVMRRLGRDATGILVILGINLVLGFVAPNISWQGHLGGLVTGVVIGTLYAYAPRTRRTAVAVAGTVVVAAALVGLVVARYAFF